MTDSPINVAIFNTGRNRPIPDRIAMHPRTIFAWLGEPMTFQRADVRDAKGELNFYGTPIRENLDLPYGSFVFEQRCGCNTSWYQPLRDVSDLTVDRDGKCTKCHGEGYHAFHTETIDEQ